MSLFNSIAQMFSNKGRGRGRAAEAQVDFDRVLQLSPEVREPLGQFIEDVRRRRTS